FWSFKNNGFCLGSIYGCTLNDIQSNDTYLCRETNNAAQPTKQANNHANTFSFRSRAAGPVFAAFNPEGTGAVTGGGAPSRPFVGVFTGFVVVKNISFYSRLVFAVKVQRYFNSPEFGFF